MNPKTLKNVNKHLKDKTELKSEKVELSLKRADENIRMAKVLEKIFDKANNNLSNLKKQARTNIGPISAGIQQSETARNGLAKASSEITELQKAIRSAGISTSELDSKKKLIDDKFMELNNLVISFTNIERDFEKITRL